MDTFVASTSATAAASTLSTGDSIDGGAGTDTLFLALGTAFSPVAGRITNVENLVLQSPAVDLDVTAISGLAMIEMQSPVDGADVTGITAGTKLGVTNTAGTHILTVRGAGLTGAADAASLTLNGVSGAAS
ncbi:MAG: hypothetical protein EB072_14885, partial [Betaproteobacteria bacterium]|nr:hypothetical protein [Betaproteobacteria bacterium]